MSLISVPDEGSQHFQDRNDHPGEYHADLFLQKQTITQGKVLPICFYTGSYKNNEQPRTDHVDLFLQKTTTTKGKSNQSFFTTINDHSGKNNADLSIQNQR
jgi:hypothetical protein